jgi:cation transport ATPase
MLASAAMSLSSISVLLSSLRLQRYGREQRYPAPR